MQGELKALNPRYSRSRLLLNKLFDKAMDETINKSQSMFENLMAKGELKQLVYRNTLLTFRLFKTEIMKLVDEYGTYARDKKEQQIPIPVEFYDRGEFEAELRFAGDALIFMMHSNVFEFPRDHVVMQTSYVKEDPNRSYCGVIYIYNFLADSFRYNRMNDSGYLIGRVFINRDMHYFIEGKREVGLLYHSFPTAKMNPEAVRDIITSAMQYTINFDLLTPSFDHLKEVSVSAMRVALDNMQIKTAKRMGFRYQADND